ncbi:hypothetical protein Hanom_Chr03g00191941 [Helianthus anomalus]
MALLDPLEDIQFAQTYLFSLDPKLNMMIDWFSSEYLRIREARSIPPILEDGRKIELMDLYLTVRKKGGNE